MKTQPQQPSNTEKKWKVFNAFARFEIRENEDDRQNIAEVFDENHAQQIVTAVNEYDENKCKADMHDELVSKMKLLTEYAEETLKSVHPKQFEIVSGYVRTCKELLKQAEQK